MKIIDITITMNEAMPNWPDNPPFERRPIASIESDGYNLSALSMTAHAGTHIDAPFHFADSGMTVDRIPLEWLIGLARVVYCPEEKLIRREWLQEIDIIGVERLLIKTRNSELWKQKGFQEDFVGLDVGAVDYFVELGVKVVGIDYLSLDAYEDKAVPVHHMLLEKGIVGIEGLDLAEVEPGDYQLVCLPLKIGGSDGAPCRAVLIPH